MNINNFVRPSDPETSQITGQKALEYSPKIQRYVADLMDDGKPRIDEEICVELNAQGKPHTADAFRHGRKALAERGLLVETGRTRPTVRGRELSREWVRASAVPNIRAALDPDLLAIAERKQEERKQRAAEKRAKKAAAAVADPQGQLLLLPPPPPVASTKHCATCTCGVPHTS